MTDLLSLQQSYEQELEQEVSRLTSQLTALENELLPLRHSETASFARIAELQKDLATAQKARRTAEINEETAVNNLRQSQEETQSWRNKAEKHEEELVLLRGEKEEAQDDLHRLKRIVAGTFPHSLSIA